MKNIILIYIEAVFFILLISCVTVSNAQDLITVKVKEKIYNSDGTRSYTDWKEHKTRTINNLSGLENFNEPGLSLSGGRKDIKTDATGFFYTKKINNRWWLIDADGYQFIHKGIVTLKPGSSKNQVKEAVKKYGSELKWLEETSNLLYDNGFNGAGNWSDADLLLQSLAKPIVYTRGFNFMSSYGKKRGGTFQQPGHTGYPKDLIFVFDPEFEKFCDEEAKKASSFKNEKYLLGYFSDNEMPFPDDALDRYLTLDKNDPGFVASEAWLKTFRGNNNSLNITSDEREAFLTFMSDKYFSIVSSALKKYDPNHMYLGCRFHGEALKKKALFISAGKYMGAVSVNYYNVWTPKMESLANWEKWSGKPVIITEWYTKAEDSKMKNVTGAGWIVPTQKDRGLFYQNFTLALLESKVCVGWHWFKYQDNDPEDKTADPSNIDANKGIMTNSFEPYQPLLDEMKKVNTKVYSIIDYFDKKK